MNVQKDGGDSKNDGQPFTQRILSQMITQKGKKKNESKRICRKVRRKV